MTFGDGKGDYQPLLSENLEEAKNEAGNKVHKCKLL